MQEPAATAPPATAVDMTRASPVRIVNYLLDGKDNFEVDRDAAADAQTSIQQLRRMAKAHVRFRQRVVRHLVEHSGVRQFLHFDGGFPHALELHRIAQEIDPTARIVYVADDPMVAAHCRALLTSDPRGAVVLVRGTAGRMADLLADPDLLAALDPDRPLGVTLSTSLMYLADDHAAAELARLRAELAPGSHLALSQLTADFDPSQVAESVTGLKARGAAHPVRTAAQLTALFTGWRLLEPGVGSILDWRPSAVDADSEGAARRPEVHVLGGVARLC